MKWTRCPAAIGGKRKWREGKSSPYTGKLSARPAGKPGYLIAQENLRRSLPRHLFSPLQRTNTEGPQYAFLRDGGIYRSDVVQTKTKPWGGTVPPPAGRPRAQVKERAGRTTLFSSSAMSSDRLFLDRVARPQSPSPLHRRPQINMASSKAQPKGDISILR